MASYYGQGKYGASSYRKDASVAVVISPSAVVTASAVNLRDASSTITAAAAIPAVSADRLAYRSATLTAAATVSATAALHYNVSVTISSTAVVPVVPITGVGSEVVTSITSTSSLTCTLEDRWNIVSVSAGSWTSIASPSDTWVPVELLATTWSEQSITT